MALPRGGGRGTGPVAASLRRHHPVQVPRVRPPAVSAEPDPGAAPLAAMGGTLIEARGPRVVSSANHVGSPTRPSPRLCSSTGTGAADSPARPARFRTPNSGPLATTVDRLHPS